MTTTAPESSPVASGIRRSERLRSLLVPPHGLSRTALTIISVVIAVDVLGIIVAWQILISDWAPYPVATALIALALGWSFSYAGVVVWARNPENRVGFLMMAVGVSWLLSQLLFSDNPAVATFGNLVMAVPFVLLGHLLLAFPSGRLESPLARANLVLGWIAVGVMPLLWLPLADADKMLCGAQGYPAISGTVDCPTNLLMIADRPGLALTLLNVERVTGLVAIAGVVAILAHRWHTRSDAWRAAVAPVVAVGAVVFVGMFVVVADDVIGEPLGVWSEWCFQALMGLLPLAFLFGFMRARHTAADLATSLADPAGGSLCSRLRAAVHDPNLDIVYPRGREDGWMDANGRPRALPEPDGHRMVTPIVTDGKTVAALIHDSTLASTSNLMETVSRGASLALENERLSAELKANLEELRDSRARIVDAGDQARRQIERNLHDGTQARLSSIMMELGLADSRFGSDPGEARALVAGARENLALALQELRDLSQGVHPGVLTERGLAVAVKELTYRHPLQVDIAIADLGDLPEQVEATAYYVIAEALANSGKHAEAQAVDVAVARRSRVLEYGVGLPGTAVASDELVVTVSDDGKGGAVPAGGLRGLADRVEAIGGEFDLVSPFRGGTRIMATLPCGNRPSS